MRSCTRSVTVAILSAFIPVASGVLTPAYAEPQAPTSASLRRYLDVFDSTRPIVPLTRSAEPVRVRAQTKPADGGGLSKGAKIGIWLGAVTVGTVWAWKTFSVTRGTD